MFTQISLQYDLYWHIYDQWCGLDEYIGSWSLCRWDNILSSKQDTSGKRYGSNYWNISLHFIKEDGSDYREEQVGVDLDTDEGEIQDVVSDDEKKRHCRMVLEDNNGGVYRMKSLIYAKKWDVYNLYKEALVKCGYYFEVSDKDGKKSI